MGTTTNYVRAAASGSQSGADWSNAYTNLPASLTRDCIYYVSGGTYPAQVLNTANSGASLITIKWASVSAHGTATGWNDSFATQATFGHIKIFTDNWVLNGVTRTESDPTATNSYGFKVLWDASQPSITPGSSFSNDSAMVKLGSLGGLAVTNITLSYLYPQCATTLPAASVRSAGFDSENDGFCTALVIDHCLVRDGNQPYFMRASTGTILDHCAAKGAIGNTDNHGETINAFYTVQGLTVRYGLFVDQFVATGGTAGIAITSGAYRDQTWGSAGLKAHGNVWLRCYYGDGTWGFNGNACDNNRVYNETVIDGNGHMGADFGSGTNNVIENVLFFANGGTGNVNFAAGITRDYNGYGGIATGNWNDATETHIQTGITSAKFVSYAGDNLRLASATVAGDSGIGSTFNTDPDGTLRNLDANWDRGAFEYWTGSQQGGSAVGRVATAGRVTLSGRVVVK